MPAPGKALSGSALAASSSVSAPSSADKVATAVTEASRLGGSARPSLARGEARRAESIFGYCAPPAARVALTGLAPPARSERYAQSEGRRRRQRSSAMPPTVASSTPPATSPMTSPSEAPESAEEELRAARLLMLMVPGGSGDAAGDAPPAGGERGAEGGSERGGEGGT